MKKTSGGIRLKQTAIALFIILFAVLVLAGFSAAANPGYDSDFTSSAALTANSATSTLTFGTSAGGCYVLFVEIESSGNFWQTTAGTITYGGTAMTNIGGIITYNTTQTVYRALYYIANPSSGGALSISGGTTALGGASSWRYRWWTYSNAACTSPIGTTSVNATNYSTGSSNQAITVAFNFTPTSTTSTIMQMLLMQGTLTSSINYGAAKGTVRVTANQATLGSVAPGFDMSDYSPGATSAYSLSQNFNPDYTTETGYGWGVEVLGIILTPTNTPTSTPVISPTITPTITQTMICDDQGNTHVGADSGSVNTGQMAASRIYLNTGTVQYMDEYCASGATGEIAFAIYSDSSGAPASMLAVSSPQTMVSGWNRAPLNYVITTAGYYWLTLQISISGPYFSYDTAGAPANSENTVATGTFPTWPATWGTGTYAASIGSVYAEVCNPCTPTMTVSPVMSPTNTPVVSNTPTWTITPTLTATPTLVTCSISYDFETSYDSEGANVTSATFSHTIGSGTNSLLLVQVNIQGSATNDTVTAITYGGVAMLPALKEPGSSNPNGDDEEIWYLINPPNGTNNVVVNIGDSAPIQAGAISYMGVNQSSPLGATATDFYTSTTKTPSVSITTLHNSSIIVNMLTYYGANGTITEGTGQTQRWLTTYAYDNQWTEGDDYFTGGPATYNMYYQFSVAKKADILSLEIAPGNCLATSTPTYTGTYTATPTYTNTKVLSPTNTPTTTSTPSITRTGTPTGTYTWTPTCTKTPTVSPTYTNTPTFTNSTTNTPTYTSTNSPVVSITPTSTQIINTWTITPSCTITLTITATPTGTPTCTITPTATPTGTPTGTMTGTPTETSTWTLTPTPTITWTSTWSPTSTVTTTNTPTYTITPTCTSTPNTPSYLGVSHTSLMPAYVAQGKAWVQAMNLTLTDPDSGNYDQIAVEGITLNVQDNNGNAIAPSTVLSGITILDASNNTIISYSSIPSTGSQVYLNFPAPVILALSSSSTINIYINISANPTESYVALNLNAPSSINAVDYSTMAAVNAQAISGDSFAMRTSAAQILSQATSVNVTHTSIMPSFVNMGQQFVGAMLLYFANTAGGLAAINAIQFTIADNTGTTIAANSAINDVHIDAYGNTSEVYADSSIAATSSSINIQLATPIVLSSGSGTTVTARFSIANPATAIYFKAGVMAASAINATDFSLGTPITVTAANDSFAMQSGIAMIQSREQTVNVSHAADSAGSVTKGEPGIQIMDLIFANPGGASASSDVITGITLTVQNSSGYISANTVFSGLTFYQQGNPANVFGTITSIGSSQYLYCNFTNPVLVSPSASNGNVTITAAVNISSLASQPQFQLGLSAAQYLSAVDENQGLYVTVAAQTPDSFPMFADYITIQAGTNIQVLHTSTMPATVTDGQNSVMPMILQFANTTSGTISITGLTITVIDQTGAGMASSSILQGIYLVDDRGNTDYSTTSIPGTSKIYMPFATGLTIGASTADTISIFVSITSTATTTAFALELSQTADVGYLPSTATVQANPVDSFPMKSGITNVQLLPLLAYVSHNDVMPSTVSTGQTNVYSEILNLYNPNVSGTANVMLTGITLTVKDNTNTVINPTRAIKSVLIQDSNSNIYCNVTNIPSSVSPFYLPFSTPIQVPVSQTVSVGVYVDIVNTLQSGSFMLSISSGNNVIFCDANTGLPITVAAMNGDSFPMNTSAAIIQQAVPYCAVSHASLIPLAVDKGQTGVSLMQLNFNNPGGSNGADMEITRVGIYIQDINNNGIIAANALSALYVTDGSGNTYAAILSLPNSSAYISIALTTPIVVQPGVTKQIFITGNISTAASVPGFKIDLSQSTDIIARDANSYNILTVQAISPDTFPDMRTSYTTIQNETTSLSLSDASLMPATVNQDQASVPVLYLNFSNPNPAGSSIAEISGITITVEDNTGTGIVPSNVISGIAITNGLSTTYGSVTLVPSTGTQVYIPFAAGLTLPAGTSSTVTVYANVASSTTGLYFQFDLSQAANISAFDVNSASPITSIAGTFPMRSSYTTIYLTPGIKILHTDTAPAVISTGQTHIPAMSFRFSNVGSLAAYVTGITISAKNQDGTDANADALIGTIYYLNNSYNIVASTSLGTGANIYLNIASSPVSIAAQSSTTGYIYFDAASATFNAVFYLSIAAGNVTGTVAVTADSGDSFPMNTKNIIMQQESSSVQVSYKDMMPPAVSTNQQNVYVMTLTLSNANPAGYSAVSVTGINLTVKDASSNTEPASLALSEITITDGINTYFSTTNMASTQYLNCVLSQAVTIAAGSSINLYCIADITSNTINPDSSFKLELPQTGLTGNDYNNSKAGISFVPAATYSFPMDSSATIIQEEATLLNAAGTSLIPANVSTGQMNVPAMNLVLTDVGNTRTASIMLTRLYLYVEDNSGNTLNPANAINEIMITSPDGSTVYGATTSFSGGRITLNLTSPIVISTASPVTVSVEVDIAPSYLNSSFRVVLNAASDMYAVDANSFQVVNTTATSGYSFPLQSNLTNVENKATGVSLDTFSQLAPNIVTMGETRVPLMAFRIDNTAASGTANADFSGITINLKDGSNNDIAANTAVNNLYLIDGNGNTLSTAAAAVSNIVPMALTSTVSLAPGSYIYVTLYADIPGTASAVSFTASIQSASMVSVTDDNSHMAVTKTATPSMPWYSSVAATTIYAAPATSLYVWHDSMLPTQVGRSQIKVMMMAMSMYNPGTAGTSSVAFNGVSLTVYDNNGNTLPPDSVFSFAQITDMTDAYFYGGATLSAMSAAAPFYLSASTPILIADSNTTTVYFMADIASNASLTSFKVAINNNSFINANNNPAGYITVSASNSDSFPMATNLATIIQSTNIIKVGHQNMMPVSAVGGQTAVNALQFNFANTSGVNMQITGITLTVRDKAGDIISANSVLSGIRIMDSSGNTIYGSAVPGSSGNVFINLTSMPLAFDVNMISQNSFRVVIDIAANAGTPFYIELDDGTDISTDQTSSIQAASGDYFGNMKSSVLSLQQAVLNNQTYHNFPNPFNPDAETTHFEYYLQDNSKVSIRIFTLDGMPVRLLLNEIDKPAGLHNEDTWDGTNDAKQKVLSGVYLAVLEVKDDITGAGTKLIKKVVVLR